MYYGKKKLQYTKMFGGGERVRSSSDRWAELDRLAWRNGPPKDVVGAILEWIDENLPEMIKQGINFNKATKTRIDFRTNPDFCSEERHGSMTFLDDRVVIKCQKGRWSFEVDWTTECEYVDPGMFDQLAAALRRIFNGT